MKQEKVEKVELGDTGCFSPIFLDYLAKKDSLKDFYHLFPTIENFGEVLKTKEWDDHNRAVLVDALSQQYGPLEHHDAVDFNIHSIKHPKTFTVTTGHQLNIFTGPLYFIYKIVTVINICKKLKEAYPEYHFVPVYWMASEDHDFAEISSFNLFDKKYEWKTVQSGRVGKFKPHSLNEIIDQLPEAVPLFEEAYLDYDTLAEAVRFYINKLFGDQGLVVIDADDHQLKSLFVPIIEKELFENQSNELVQTASGRLNEAGYQNQAFSREINLFYIENGLRERIVREGEQFKVLNTDKIFSGPEIAKLLLEQPELFSPNVITRPLYQECILPNLAYIGGPAEIAYWLQLKDIFDHYQIPFPILMPRNFAMIISKGIDKKLKKLGLHPLHAFKNAHEIKEIYLEKHLKNGFALEKEHNAMVKVFDSIKARAEEIDVSLTGFIGAESAKTFKSLETISKRLKRAEEQNNETAMSQIDHIKQKLFPEGNLQERHDNFLNFYLNNPNFIRELIDNFDPFDFRFNIVHHS